MSNLEVPGDIIKAAEKIRAWMMTNNFALGEIGPISVSLRTVDEITLTAFAETIAKTIKMVKQDISKVEYTGSNLANEYAIVLQHGTFRHDLSSDGQFSGGYHTCTYEIHNFLFFFDFDDDGELISGYSVKKFEYLEWKKKDSFALARACE